MIELDRVGWENGTLVSPAKVNVQGTVYDVEPEIYSGNTPLSAELLKEMEDNTENAINEGILQPNTFSTTETRIGTWIDGKPIYRTVVNIGQLSSNIGQTSYAHGIANIDTFTNVTGIINNGTEWFNFNSVYRAVDTITYDLGLLANKTKITYTTRTDRSAYTGIVILEYTKTTD